MPSSLDAIARQTLARGCAADLRDRFADYNARFRAVTQRARLRFETRDWAGARADAVERIELYDRCVTETTTHLQLKLGPRADDKALWAAIRIEYAQLIDPLLDRELYKTFFNTLTRRFFGTRGVDASIEFVALDIEPNAPSPVCSTTTASPRPTPMPPTARAASPTRSCAGSRPGAAHRSRRWRCSRPCSSASSAPTWSAGCSARGASRRW
jgi:isocitrate dehydrogenase kinase/phosphatase